MSETAEQLKLVSSLARMLREARLPLHDEKQTQAIFAELMTEKGIEYSREHRLSGNDIVDFMIEGVAVELKLRGGKRNIWRQLERYSKHDEVEALLLVTNTAMGLPPEVNGKDIYYCSLGAAWL